MRYKFIGVRKYAEMFRWRDRRDDALKKLNHLTTGDIVSIMVNTKGSKFKYDLVVDKERHHNISEMCVFKCFKEGITIRDVI